LMKLLVLGGTVFLGRAVVDAALAAGHEVTMFNRGKNNADLYPDVEKLRGDRDGDLTALEGRNWDAVIDTCGYVPRLVGDSAKLLADQVEHYVFVSSISVYPDLAIEGLTETDNTGTLEDPTVEEVNGETYGPLKALCEQAAEAAMPGRVCHVRAGLIVGPHDQSDRFTYWPHRVAKGGEVLAPGTPDFPVQFVDVRDLAEWMVRMAEARQAGVYNVTGPERTLALGEVLETSKTVSGSDATFTWMDEKFLVENEVGPWMEMPLWVTQDAKGIMKANVERALQAGLTFRSLEDTVRDTLAWDQSRAEDVERKAGMDSEKEQSLLGTWRAQSAA
jgi:2'-hydroxyisoflavone reductase